MSRERAVDVRDDPETRLVREFVVPNAGAFELTGEARINGRATDVVLSEVLGLDDTVSVRASDRMIGGVAQGAASAVDGDESTAWMPPFGEQRGQWIELEFADAITIDAFDLAVWADGRHSVPTVLSLQTDEGAQEVRLDQIDDDPSTENAVARQRVEFDSVTTSVLRVAVVEVRETRTTDWFSAHVETMPIAVAAIDVPGVAVNAPNLSHLTDCRDDLLAIDGVPIPVRLAPGATLSDAMSVEPCDGRVELGAGTHRVETAAGRHDGIDIDRLTLRSERAEPVVAAVPTLEIVEHGRGAATVTFSDATEPFWLVLGESYGHGWRADVTGGPALGEPALVDGFANGWYVDPAVAGSTGTIVLDWAPNRTVHQGFVASIVGTLLVLGLAARRPGNRMYTPSPMPSVVVPITPARARRDRIVVALAAALAAAAVTRWWIGGLIGLATFIACSPGRVRRALLAALAVASVATMGAYVVALQFRWGGLHNGSWPQLWDRAHLLGWVALGTIIGELAIELLDRLRSPRPEATP